MEKMDLSGHQRGMLKLASRTIFAPFERHFCVKIVDCQREEQEEEQESDVELISVGLSHKTL